ncbi:hypothetical protein [Streptomyces sp. GMR22]|uniref:hypothetical protein n=1 Tax=Streptomyces sp. GMR22 TaxID=2759524 RepID=UPI0015FB7C02|nr:hypothetical protein [Streptomyces sp. GMR22]MBA6435133.1 hypothetical protein [Streptomyces sp. GMR22]
MRKAVVDWLALLGVWIMVLAVPVVVLGGLGVLVWSVLDDDEGLQELSDLHRLCGKNHEGFGEAAPYGGGGPHPLVLFAGGTDLPAHATDGQNGKPTPKDVQLVACASRPARASDRVSESCTYVGGETDSSGFGGSVTIDQYPGKVDVTVYEARTGRPVDEFRLSGPDKLKCESAVLEGTKSHDVITVPSTSDYVPRLEEYVTENAKP